MVTDATTADLARFGAFFTVESHSPDAAPAPPWRPLSDLVGDPEVLRDRVAAVRERLAGGRAATSVELRVAASAAHLGLIARVISPALAIAATTSEVPCLDLAALWWQPLLGGPFPLSVPVTSALDAPAPRTPPSAATIQETAARMVARVLVGPVRELTETVRPLSVPPRTLWGNVASAVNTAATLIATTPPTDAHADHRPAARDLAALLLDRPPLRGMATRTDGVFRRRNCCLIYRAAPDFAGPVCGDCVLAQHPRGTPRGTA